MTVYVGSKGSLDLIAWNETAPAFHVTELSERDSVVRNQFTEPYVYYVGSHEGCGCGFQYGQYPEFEQGEDRSQERASLDGLATYLSHQLSRVGTIQLYACWDGDQTAIPEHHRNLTPGSFRSEEEFYFLEKELSTVAEAEGQKETTDGRQCC